MLVPVVDGNQNPLMPTKPSRARRWIKEGKATPFWSHGIFCVRLNVDPSDKEFQEICVGIDPGSKKEGFTVKSEAHTFLNIQVNAHNKVGRKIEKRRELRRSRRSRKCPNRKNRTNRLSNKERIPAGTRARWDWKLRILNWISRFYPITHVCVEDIKARTIQHARKWNASFSPLEVGKNWFYNEIKKKWELFLLRGFETKEIRDRIGLEKSTNKLVESFNAHCVDSWCLAYNTIGGEPIVDNKDVLFLSPIIIHRRNLHRANFRKGGVRHRYGGTKCLHTFKNAIVKHITEGILRVGGFYPWGLNLNRVSSNKFALTAKVEDCKILRRLNFLYY